MADKKEKKEKKEKKVLTAKDLDRMPSKYTVTVEKQKLTGEKKLFKTNSVGYKMSDNVVIAGVPCWVGITIVAKGSKKL